MLGAIIGDMVGSIYEFNPIKSKEFDIYNSAFYMTDDSMLTLAVINVLKKHFPLNYSPSSLDKIKKDLVKEFVNVVKREPGRGYGGFFFDWAMGKNDYQPYNSYGNGSAMRISPVGWVAENEEQVKILSKAISEVTHNHPEGIKGAEAIAMCIFWARTGVSKEEIKKRVIERYYPEVNDFDFDTLVKTYTFSEICQKSCPQAIYCFLISSSLEDTIRNCVAIGGDCDTTGAMAGAIAEAFYQKEALSSFEDKFIYLLLEPIYVSILRGFYQLLGNHKLDNVK